MPRLTHQTSARARRGQLAATGRLAGLVVPHAGGRGCAYRIRWAHLPAMLRTVAIGAPYAGRPFHEFQQHAFRRSRGGRLCRGCADVGHQPPARSLTGGRRGEALHTCASGRAARPFCIAWEISNCGSNRVWLAAAKGRIRADPLVGRQRAKR